MVPALGLPAGSHWFSAKLGVLLGQRHRLSREPGVCLSVFRLSERLDSRLCYL